MKFFEDIVKQERKYNQMVCGDTFLCERTPETTIFVLCDGIGSGIYANISAITCANRLIELYRSGVSMQDTCKMVAESMHVAKGKDVPYSAFSVVKILKEGQFTVYYYEFPSPLLIKNGTTFTLKPAFHIEGCEIIAESSGVLELGDGLIILSDGATQAGLGRKYPLGIGEDGIAKSINRELSKGTDLQTLPSYVLDMTAEESGGYFEDDTTVAVLNCRKANQFSMFTGPPSNRLKDREVVERFMSLSGVRAVCGSTTADIVARELSKKVDIVNGGKSIGIPPEYIIEDIDIVSEGAIVLNQVYNILDENPEIFTQVSVVDRLCTLMLNADVITFIVGMAVNDAHKALSFKQMGIRSRWTAINLIEEKLREKGKLVIMESY